MMNKDSIGRGVVYLYIEAITMLFSGYIYWLILSKITDPSTIGLASTVIALATIMVSIASLGVAGGVQRFLSNSISESKLQSIQNVINSAVFITGIGIVGSVIAILFFNEIITDFFDIQLGYLVLSIFIFSFMVVTALLRALIIPSLKVKVITVASILSTVIKILITIVLVLSDQGVTGILVGFLMYPVFSSIIFAIAIKKYIYRNNIKLDFSNLFRSYKDIFVTSMTFWIPGVISTIGSQLGTISVFLSLGSTNAGVYFISFSLVMGIAVIISVLSSMAYPIISSMKDGRKRSTWRLIKVSLILTLPISNILLFYSSDILSLFGQSYISGSSVLEILLFSSLPTSVSTGIGVLIYSYGMNREFLFLGLATSIPRVLLYFIFVPMLGGIGAALSYVLGSLIGALVALVYAKKIGIVLKYFQIVMLFFIPILITIPFKFFDFNYLVSIVVILFMSYLLLIFTRVINSNDLDDLLRVIPADLRPRVWALMSLISNKLKRN